MLDSSVRLLELLSLLASRRYWTGPDLAARLEVTERTLRRDIDKLRQLGYLVSSTSGVAGGYQLSAGSALPPLMLDRQEAQAVALGLRTAATSSIAGIVEASTRALAKLERVLPRPIRRKVEALSAAVVPLDFSGPMVDLQVLGVLAGACQDAEVLQFQYTDRAGTVSDRVLEPHGVACLSSLWYLAAWDRGRDAFRTFRLDRIREVRPQGKSFVQRTLPGGSVAAYVSASVRTSADPQPARILFRAPLAKMQRLIPTGVGQLEALDETRCVLHTRPASLQRTALHTALLGIEFEVVDPPEMKAVLREIGARMVRAAGG